MKTEDKTTCVVAASNHSKPIHTRENPAIPAWIERAAWTNGMLTALQGDKPIKWYSLADKLGCADNLRAAWTYVQSRSKSVGVDRQSLESFARKHEECLVNLQTELKQGSYKPAPMLRKYIPKLGSSKMRPIGISTVRDRIVHAAVKQSIEPIFERVFLDCSFGFRPGRGAKDALRKVQSLLNQGYRWVVDADIESFFDSIDHDLLRDAIRVHVVDSKVLSLVDLLVKQPVMEGEIKTYPTKGTPQGSILSPLLANIFLHSMDQTLTNAGLQVVRYADDLVILCKSETEANTALEQLKTECGKRKLTIHPSKTKVVNEAEDEFDFLGYTFRKGDRFPKIAASKKWRAAIVALTPRSVGKSIHTVIDRVNKTLSGIFEYFKHSSYGRAFAKLDQFVRRRLRAILLRQNHKTYTYGRGRAHNAWPNKWFADQGLISVWEAHANQREAWNSARQSR